MSRIRIDGDEHGPREDRHPEHRHARRTHREDRGDEVDRTEDGAETTEREAEDPEVTADTGAVGRVGEGRVGEPAEGGGSAGGEEASRRNEPTEEVEPVGKHVQAREGDIRRTDLQRHERIGEAREERCREEQQHDRAVHREQLVELVGVVDQLQTRLEQLGADDQGHRATEQEPDERGDEVEVADDLVVGRGDPLDDGRSRRQPVGRPGGFGGAVHGPAVDDCAHGQPLAFSGRSFSWPFINC
jgi:hypothetical protein